MAGLIERPEWCRRDEYPGMSVVNLGPNGCYGIRRTIDGKHTSAKANQRTLRQQRPKALNDPVKRLDFFVVAPSYRKLHHSTLND
jgi:hypothetical protein